jgi:beta-phosphoglucomutase-like phosphatase (HAD superfamily)
MVAAVIFDMDGVLIDSEPLWREAERGVFAELGLVLSDADCQHTMGLRTDELVAYWHHRHPWQGRSQAVVHPAGCVAIEDSVRGVQAAVAAGMRVVAVPPPGHFDDPELDVAHLKLRSLEEFSIGLLRWEG